MQGNPDPKIDHTLRAFWKKNFLLTSDELGFSV